MTAATIPYVPRLLLSERDWLRSRAADGVGFRPRWIRRSKLRAHRSVVVRQLSASARLV